MLSKGFAILGAAFLPHGGCPVAARPLYPLPVPAPFPREPLAPSAPGYVQSRRRRQDITAKRCRQILTSLNELHELRCRDLRANPSCGVPSTSSTSSAEPHSWSSAEALRRVRRCHLANRPPPGVEVGLGALRALAKSRDLYSLEPFELCRYNPSLLNIFREEGTRRLASLGPLLSGRESR